MPRTKPSSLLKQVHSLKRTLLEVAYYPPHGPRGYFGSKFKAVEDRLCKKEDLPCLVCGVRHSTLKKKGANPYGATQMEAHHRLIEWSLTNAVDLAKFNARIYPYLRSKQPAKYPRPFTQAQLIDWIDHDVDNLWVLCNVHHRGRLHGIHSITGPIWGPQDLLTDTFLADVRTRLAHALPPPTTARHGAR